MKKTLLSILCPTYNHEKYVKYFLDSLLAQTNPNWELLIVDDCSTDNNVAEIKKYKDSRIKLIQNPFNMGIDCGLNRAFDASKGQYISFCASDDMLMPDYVENVFNCFEQHPDKDLLYCDLRVIDDNNRITGRVFTNPRTDRYNVLKHMFFVGNCLLSPGMTAKRDLFKTLLPLDIPMSQYQDYKMHINLLLRTDYMIMDKMCVLYRKDDDTKSGLSANNSRSTKCKRLEENLLMDSYLKIQNVSLLKRIFNEDMDEFNRVSKETIPFVLGMLALKSPQKYKQIWGYNQVVKFINNPDHYALVNKMYGFSYKSFLGLEKYFGTDVIETKYNKYKILFNVLCIITGVLCVLLLVSMI